MTKEKIKEEVLEELAKDKGWAELTPKGEIIRTKEWFDTFFESSYAKKALVDGIDLAIEKTAKHYEQKLSEKEKELEELMKRIVVFCPHCKKITTLWETIDECSYGGSGMCMCDWTSDDRVLYPYEEVKKSDIARLFELQKALREQELRLAGEYKKALAEKEEHNMLLMARVEGLQKSEKELEEQTELCRSAQSSYFELYKDYSKLRKKFKELEEKNKTLRIDNELWRHNSQTALKQNDEVWKKRIKELEKRIEIDKEYIDTQLLPKIKELKEDIHCWKVCAKGNFELGKESICEKIEEIIPMMNDLYATDDECWTEIRKDLMKVIKGILDGSEKDVAMRRNTPRVPRTQGGLCPSEKQSGKKEAE